MNIEFRLRPLKPGYLNIRQSDATKKGEVDRWKAALVSLEGVFNGLPFVDKMGPRDGLEYPIKLADGKKTITKAEAEFAAAQCRGVLQLHEGFSFSVDKKLLEE